MLRRLLKNPSPLQRLSDEVFCFILAFNWPAIVAASVALASSFLLVFLVQTHMFVDKNSLFPAMPDSR